MKLLSKKKNLLKGEKIHIKKYKLSYNITISGEIKNRQNFKQIMIPCLFYNYFKVLKQFYLIKCLQ